MTKAFVRNIEQFVAAEGVDLIAFEKGQRKDDVTKKYLQRGVPLCSPAPYLAIESSGARNNEEFGFLEHTRNAIGYDACHNLRVDGVFLPDEPHGGRVDEALDPVGLTV